MPPLSALQRQPLEVQALIDEMLGRGVTCANIAARLLAEHDIETSAAAVGRYRKNIWLPKVEQQRGMLALLEITDPSDPSRSLGKVNIALAQTVLRDNLELLALDEDAAPDTAIPLALKALTAQEKANKAVSTEITAAIKSYELDEIRKAADGELFVKKDDKLVRVEFVEPQAACAPQPEAKKRRKRAKKLPAGEAKTKP